MIEKRCADALSARDSAGVHPFELSVISGEFSDRAHGQQLAVRALKNVTAESTRRATSKA